MCFLIWSCCCLCARSAAWLVASGVHHEGSARYSFRRTPVTSHRRQRSIQRKHLDCKHSTFDAAHVLVHAFIHSQVDYCNAILYGVRDGVIRKLQSVLHAAARLVTGVLRNEYLDDPSWCAPLATSQAADHLQDCNDGVHSVVFVVRARRISLTSARQFRQLPDELPDVPRYALRTMVTSLFCLQNRRHLAVVAFALMCLLSGKVYQLTFSTST